MRTEIEAGRAAMPEEPKRTSDGGPAFPVTHREHSVAPGMALRDWFAGQALAAVISVCAASERKEGETLAQMFARKAYEAADAMLAERGA